MKKIKTAACLLMCAVFTAAFSACSFIDSFTGNVDTESVSEASGSEEEAETQLSSRTVDTGIEPPVFNADITSSVTAAQGGVYVLDGTAVSADGGEITYQWYVNNVSSNGGGTAIEGATEPLLTVDTAEIGFKYYYVVASNNHGDSYNMATSGIAEVEVISGGEWSTDEFGGTRYMAADGSYPTNRWVIIGSDRYCFDENGYRRTGWYLDGETYVYFDEEGRYQPDTVVPEGAYIDENGNLVQPDAQSAPAADTAPAADQPAAQ